MKNRFAKHLLFYTVLTILIISCRTPGRDDKKKVTVDTSWLEEMTISELQLGYKEGKYLIADVVSAYLDRIIELDKTGPGLNSIIMINPDALQIAEELDREMTSGKSRGPLHGVPVILKDNIDTGDKMPTTAGSTALRDSYAKADSYIAKKLREAGAVIIAKANLSEWANFRAKTSRADGAVWAARPGILTYSTGTLRFELRIRVAVSANLCMVAIGTETDGSIVCPSNNNGIVGIKPTVGLLSRTGIIPIAFTQDTPGPMARTVEDAAACLGTMTGVDSLDSKTIASAENP